jgi:hypothetical protein
MCYGKVSLTSLILSLFKTDTLTKSLRALTHQRKTNMQICQSFLPTTGTGLV